MDSAHIRFPHVDAPSAHLAGIVTERIWPCVMLQWEWLGGPPPQRPPIASDAGETRTRAA